MLLRLIGVIALHVPRPNRTVTVDLLRRAVEIAMALLLILVVLPSLMGAAG